MRDLHLETVAAAFTALTTNNLYKTGKNENINYGGKYKKSNIPCKTRSARTKADLDAYPAAYPPDPDPAARQHDDDASSHSSAEHHHHRKAPCPAVCSPAETRVSRPHDPTNAPVPRRRRVRSSHDQAHDDYGFLLLLRWRRRPGRLSSCLPWSSVARSRV